MIDLHLHTNASDGLSTPRQLVGAARAVGLTTLAVTDHDTVAALDEVADACRREGIRWVPGIEVSAARGGAEVHVLGYFFDHRSPALLAFLDGQRADRVRRITEMIERLRTLGLSVQESDVFGDHVRRGRAIGRPFLARAMVRAGHVKTPREAFDLYLGEGRPAFVPRCAPSPDEVVTLVHQAGGIASLAHPALLGHDEWIVEMSARGLDAIEAYYSEHSGDVVDRYRLLAAQLGLAITGGSDYHGHVGHGPQRPGDGLLPPDEFARLEERARSRRAGGEDKPL